MVICANPHAHDPLHLEKAYFVHSFSNLSNFYCIRCAISIFTKAFWSEKTIKWCPKILSSKMQTDHMCKPHHACYPFHLEKAYLGHSFVDLSDFFCIGCVVWSFLKHFWNAKTIYWHPKILSSEMQIGHMCQLHHVCDPLHLEFFFYTFFFTIVMTFLVRECYGSPKKQEF